MSTAGYLQDAKNQQKRLAEIITAKGITATATEKYKDLVDKAAQIENLKGEEMTLENFTNALNEPKSIVQLEYPDNTPKTLNAKLGSKNLIPYPYFDTTKTLNGITFTVNADGSISFSGTTTGQATFYFVYKAMNLKQGVTYTLSASGNYSFGGSATIFIYDSAQGQSAYIPLLTDTSTTFTPTKNINNTNCYLVIPANRTASGTLKPQLELGSTATAYTPYISDFSTVTVTRCGKNLFNKSTLTAGTSVVELTQTTNGFTFKTAATSKTMNVGSYIYLPAGTYYCSGTVACSDTSYKGGWAVYDNENKKFIINNAYKGIIDNSFTVTESKTYSLNFYASYNAPIGVTMTFENVQLELGSTATAYEPYQGQIYTPTATGEVTGITNLYPTTMLLTDNAGVLFEQVTGGFYKEILPSTDKNGITKVYQPSVDSTIDSNIKPENIKKGVKILGILGTYDGN